MQASLTKRMLKKLCAGWCCERKKSLAGVVKTLPGCCKEHLKGSTETEGKKGAVSVPFHNARVPFSTIFAGFPLSVKFQLNTGMES